MLQQASLIPESAPFSEEQRAWLNGFLAGWIGLNGGSEPAVSAMDAGPAAALAALEPPAPEEDFPWHDPALTLDERLALAEEKPLERRLMAAMAQLDCGSCGYDCKRYAEAIASGEETSLTLCSPGGKETARKVKELVKLEAPAASNGAATPAAKRNGAASAPSAAWSRTNPFTATVREIRNLNGDGSAKQTSHVEIDLSGSGLTYEVGDSLGVYPTNCPELAHDVIDQLHAAADDLVTVGERELPLIDALCGHLCLGEITDELIELMSDRSGDVGQANLLRQLLDEPQPIDGWDVLDLLQSFSSARLTGEELCRALAPSKPRLYSISSSLKAHPDQVHLTVGRVSWSFRDRLRKGVASTMFSDRLQEDDPVRVFVQKSHGFAVPADPAAAMIMIGPGTGIAPFRAFLQERRATGATGDNWLFFGDQRGRTDFLYRDELEAWQKTGLLTRLDTAFSRDQAEKTYVQHRMLSAGAELWRWLEAGAHVYVCGDAKRMAVDVDAALRRIIAEHGRMSPDDADVRVKEMAANRRYCRDVY